MAKKKLHAGTGAEASILTRFIKPKQPLPLGNKDHRSDIILDDKFEDEKGKKFFHFRYAADISSPLLSGARSHVKVDKEGDPSLFFDGHGTADVVAFKEPKTKWRKSEAKKLLYKDIMEGRVPIDAKEDGNNKLALKDIYSLRPEYAEYDYNKFSSRISSIRSTMKKNISRAKDDQAAFDLYVETNPVSYFSHKGYIQWQGSESQRLLQEDIANGRLEEWGKMELWQSRQEYHFEFPLKEFRDKIDQEIGTAKYLYTLKVKGKQHKSS